MGKRYQLLESLKMKISSDSPLVLQTLEQSVIELGLAFNQEFFSILSYKCLLPLSQLAISMFLLDRYAALIDIMARIILINYNKSLTLNQGLEIIIEFLKTEKNY
jgi:hypothetical protein